MPKTSQSYRPHVMGTSHMVSAGHPLAAAAGFRILAEGGNAVDAGVASGIALNVVRPTSTNFGGVAPIIIYLAASDSVVTISGLGRWPRSASIEYFNRNAGGEIPMGILRTVVPSAADAWLTALEKYGTMSFEQVAAPALELAEQGHPVSASVLRALLRSSDEEWPSQPGELLVQKDLARTFRRLAEVEKANGSRGRQAAIRAARDYFYKGDIAEEMARFSREQGGLLTLDDLKEFSVKVEEPVVGRFRDYSVYTCGPWCQGPVAAQTLQMLENDDLAGLGHNSPDYIHLLSQALNLAFADREHYYGDPDHVDVPIDGLLSKQYTTARRGAIDMERAFPRDAAAGRPVAVPGRRAVRRGGAAARGPGGRSPGAGHELHLHGRSVGQRLLGDAQRRRGRVQSHPRPGVHAVGQGHAELAGTRPSLQPAALEAATPDPQPRHRIQAGEAADAVRSAGGRRAVPGHGPDVPEHRRVRHGAPGRGRAAAVHVLELPQLVLAARISAGAPVRRGHGTREPRSGSSAAAATIWRCCTMRGRSPARSRASSSTRSRAS